MMAKLDSFLDSLINYSVENINPEVVKSIQPYLKNPEFNPDLVRTKSSAAAGNRINLKNGQKIQKTSFLIDFLKDYANGSSILWNITKSGQSSSPKEKPSAKQL